MSLHQIAKLADVKSRRADLRKTDLLRCRREVERAKTALREAQQRIEHFRAERVAVQHEAYMAVRGVELSERDLRRLNERLDNLLIQEREMVTKLDSFHADVASAEESVRQAVSRYQLARRNRDKWTSMIEPLRAAQLRESERLTEIDRDELASAQFHVRRG